MFFKATDALELFMAADLLFEHDKRSGFFFIGKRSVRCQEKTAYLSWSEDFWIIDSEEEFRTLCTDDYCENLRRNKADFERLINLPEMTLFEKHESHRRLCGANYHVSESVFVEADRESKMRMFSLNMWLKIARDAVFRGCSVSPYMNIIESIVSKIPCLSAVSLENLLSSSQVNDGR